MTEIVGELVEHYTKAEVATSLDKLKELGFEYSTRAGLTISIADVRTPAAKAEILDKHEKDAEKVEQQYDRGIITDDERRQKEIEIWTDATNQVTEAMQNELVADAVQPDRDDGRVGRPWKRHAGPPDRRRAWPGGRPAW